jgi:hypothetical protein
MNRTTWNLTQDSCKGGNAKLVQGSSNTKEVELGMENHAQDRASNLTSLLISVHLGTARLVIEDRVIKSLIWCCKYAIVNDRFWLLLSVML